MLLDQCVLDDITTSGALDISHILVADAPVAFKVPDAYRLFADGASNFSVLALTLIMLLQLRMCYTQPAF